MIRSVALHQYLRSVIFSSFFNFFDLYHFLIFNFFDWFQSTILLFCLITKEEIEPPFISLSVANRRRVQQKSVMKKFWFEAILQLGIISEFLCVMGNSQYYIYKWQDNAEQNYNYEDLT